MKQFSTRQVGQILKIRPTTLSRAIWDCVVKAPPKSPSGNYLWSISDIERASWVMKRYPQFKAWRQREGGGVQ